MNSNGFERRRVVRMIRRPRQPSWDYNDTFTSTESEPRSYSVIRRVRRLQTRTSPILTSSKDFASVKELLVFNSTNFFDSFSHHRQDKLYSFENENW